MKQSSIEWLVNEIQSLLDSGFLFNPENEYEIINQAKEMHKQEVIDARLDACIEYSGTETAIIMDIETSEQYYNDKFKQI